MSVEFVSLFDISFKIVLGFVVAETAGEEFETSRALERAVALVMLASIRDK